MKPIFKKLTMAIALLVPIGCGNDKTPQNNGSAWEICETSSDCDEGYSCLTGRCESANNQTTGENNETTGSSNNVGSSNNTTGGSNNGNNATNNMSGGSNNTTGGTNNGTNGTICPLTGAPVPAELPAVHTVTFTLQNEYPQPVWVVSEGWFCSAFEIENVGTTAGASCGCECPNPGSPHAMTLRQVPADGTIELQWDGRGLIAYQECLECGREPVFEGNAVRQPVADGEYFVQLDFARSLPSNCTDNGDGTATCTDPDVGAGISSFAAIAPPCELPNAIGSGQRFMMPAPGAAAEEIDVTVVLPVLP